ncbi:MAG: NHL repeat-containing protein, partial [Chloroflexota bacterium]|nr:NHL repeat-containing protein [Chloroflexota bacterium]
MNRTSGLRTRLLPTLIAAALLTFSALYLAYVHPSPVDPANAQAADAADSRALISVNAITEAPLGQPVRGRSGDLWADVILGKSDFSQIGPGEIVPFKVFNPGGVIVDRSVAPGRAYIWDAGNSRILGIDLEKCYASEGPCSADIVIGQPAASDHGACNGDSGVQNFPDRAPASAETLCSIPDVSQSPTEHKSIASMAIDSDGALYVPDSYNNRVLRYDDPFGSDTRADEVWGQRDFSGMMCNRGDFGSATAETLCFHADSNRFVDGLYSAGVELDSEGNLWVADSGNNRVLRFPASGGSGAIAKRADLVIGQQGFRGTAPGTSMRSFHTPSALRFDSRERLYVVDTDNNRVLAFHPPFTSGMESNATIGSRLNNPVSIEVDPHDRGLWVNDQRNGMVELWDWGGPELLAFIGKPSYEPQEGSGPGFGSVPGWPSIWDATGIAFDAHDNMLVSLAAGPQDVLRIPVGSQGDLRARAFQADKRLFYPPGEYNNQGLKGLRTPRGVAVYGDQLVVPDFQRLLYWNGLDELSNGQEADGAVGNAEWRPRANCCGRVKA